MTKIKIVDYENEMKDLVHTLFCSIYPEQPFIADKMCYDKCPITLQQKLLLKTIYTQTPAYALRVGVFLYQNSSNPPEDCVL